MKKQQKTLAMWIIFILAMVLMMNHFQQKKTVSKNIQFAEFYNAVEQGNVKEVTIQKSEGKIQGKFVDGYENGSYFNLSGDTGDETFKFLKANGIIPNYKAPEKESFFTQIFISMLPILFLLFLFLFKASTRWRRKSDEFWQV